MCGAGGGVHGPYSARLAGLRDIARITRVRGPGGARNISDKIDFH